MIDENVLPTTLKGLLAVVSFYPPIFKNGSSPTNYSFRMVSIDIQRPRFFKTGDTGLCQSSLPRLKFVMGAGLARSG